MKKWITGLAVFSAVVSVQAGSLVNWGVADTGADMFAASANHNPKPTDVYTVGNVYGDETTHSGSSVAPVESQTYNAAAFATGALGISKDISDVVGSGSADGGDAIYLQDGDSTSMKAMVVWENFASTNTTLDSIAVGGRYVGDSGTFSYLIERDNGDSTTSWYVSAPALTLGLSYTSASNANPVSLTWYTFTPLNNNGGVVGSVATPNMDNITSVGVYADIAKTVAGNTGFKVNYFNATASEASEPPVDPAPSFSSDSLSKPNADEGVAYTNSIAGDVSYTGLDAMMFSLLDAPSWLSVATNGTITGTPGSGDVGPNAFSVQVSATGGVDTATLNITVNAEPGVPPDSDVAIDFITEEGYVDGNLDTHTNWVSETANVVDINADGYNGAKGLVALDADTANVESVANLLGALSVAGSNMTFSSTFRFTSTGNVVTTAKDLYTHTYNKTWATDADQLRVILRRETNVANSYDIRVKGTNNKYSSEVSGTLLGLATDGTGTTDWLQLTSSLIRGASEAEWSVAVELVNLNTASTLISETLTDTESILSFFEEGAYYPGFSSGTKDVDGLTADRQIDAFDIMYAPLAPSPAFDVDRITKPVADIDVAYTNSIAGDASDPKDDPMTYSLVGPASWLSIDSYGTIIGMPGPGDAGQNEFTVQVSSVNGIDTAKLIVFVNEAPGDPSDWEEFVDGYSLSGFKFDDADNDAMADAYEFAYGGNPTNPADRGTYYLQYEEDDSVRFVALEMTNSEPGISLSYTAEWTGNLASNDWQQDWDATNSATAALAGYNEVERVIDGSTRDQVFVRDSAFNLDRPNILMIVCDDLGYADIGFGAALFGEKDGSTQAGRSYTSPFTPAIDTLASDGMILTQAYIPHPFCGPSRMGLLTGRYPHHIGGSKNLPYEVKDLPSQGVRDLWGFEAANDLGIPTNEVTIAKVLQDAGYYTGAFGKWHCGVASNTHPNVVGFDYWYGMLGGGHNYYSDGWMSKDDPNLVNDYQMWLTRNGDEVPPPDVPAPGLYLTDMISDDAVTFITNAPPEQPFFMYLCYNAPHAPLTAKVEDLIYMFGGTGQDDGSYTKQEESVAMMYAVDRGVSNIVATLKANGQFDNTMIILLSDNGGKEMAFENDADNGPFKGGKGDVYEGGVRTPMFIHYPNAIAPGLVYEHPMYPYDLYPTFARLGEAAIPEDKVLSGVDIWDEILANQDAHTNDTVFWVRHNAGANNVGMRNGRYKANRLNNGAWKLYDIVDDISEINDIASGNGAIINNMLVDGNNWKTNGVDPLWHDTEIGYTNWVVNGMPNYDESFSD